MDRIPQGALSEPPEVSVLELAEMPERVVDGRRISTAKLKGRIVSTVKLKGCMMSTTKLNGPKN